MSVKSAFKRVLSFCKKAVKNVELHQEYYAKKNSDDMLYACVQNIVANLNSNPTAPFGELNLLCDKFGSDKGSNFNKADAKIHGYPWHPHSYTSIYETLFRGLKFEKLNVFECGIGTNNVKVESNMTKNGHPGASLRVWKNYFINSDIFGADIDEGCLFEEERIKTGWIDQTNPVAIKEYFKKTNVEFDIMIDDGLHKAEAAITLFENAFEFLKKGGIYIIEDLFIEDIYKVREVLAKRDDVVVQYAIMQTEKLIDNNLIICRKK